MEIAPEDAGLARCDLEALAGGDARACATIARRILDGEEGAPGNAVVLNAAATLCAAGVAADLSEGASRAREALESGRARELLARVVEVSGS
jgi:anthranilate phosphoribosyltransferase